MQIKIARLINRLATHWVVGGVWGIRDNILLIFHAFPSLNRKIALLGKPCLAIMVKKTKIHIVR
ncbi:hypothetical protein CW304_14795 [Bacillus sp. UFRGS-B20]|nr:hypothetical protein CW304_14795 [Bacillus sp. UFRGS-B20]